jgi:hypothetical protein
MNEENQRLLICERKPFNFNQREREKEVDVLAKKIHSELKAKFLISIQKPAVV